MKRLIITGLGAIALLIIVVVVRTLMHQPPAAVNATVVEIELNESALAERLSQSIQFQTVSFQSSDLKDQSQFTGFIDWVHASYPRVQESLSISSSTTPCSIAGRVLTPPCSLFLLLGITMWCR